MDTTLLSRALAHLTRLPSHSEEENTLSLVISGEDKFAPELMQVIQTEDGQYLYHHVAPDTHEIIEEYPVDPFTFQFPCQQFMELNLLHGDTEIEVE